MNIFYLHESPKVSAQAMTDKHVVKMILESAQLLSTAHHVLDGDDAVNKHLLYKPTHRNHPSAIWARESSANYEWLYEHFLALCEEYTNRYHKVHMTQTKLQNILSHLPIHIPHNDLTPIRVAISNPIWHSKKPIDSYRNYYMGEKLKLDKDIQRYQQVILNTI